MVFVYKQCLSRDLSGFSVRSPKVKVSYIFEEDKHGPRKIEETLTLGDLTENPERSRDLHLFLRFVTGD